MANQWLTAIADAQWVKELYGNEPINPSSKVLVRAIYGIDRTKSDTIILSLANVLYVSNPKADNQTYSGSWRVIKNEIMPLGNGALSGSDKLIQTLGQGYFETLTSENLLLLKTECDKEEQNENAWMYYERSVVNESSRWVNLTEAKAKENFPYDASATMSQSLSGYDAPVIVRNWYEREQDGSYSMYRILQARKLVATVKYRAVKYGGMIVIDTANLPILGENHFHLTGFRNLTETIAQYAKIIVGGETYRVAADVTASAGAVEVVVIPEITQTTEDYCDTADGSARQVYFEALT